MDDHVRVLHERIDEWVAKLDGDLGELGKRLEKLEKAKDDAEMYAAEQRELE